MAGEEQDSTGVILRVTIALTMSSICRHVTRRQTLGGNQAFAFLNMSETGGRAKQLEKGLGAFAVPTSFIEEC